jgi:hypothetical protein
MFDLSVRHHVSRGRSWMAAACVALVAMGVVAMAAAGRQEPADAGHDLHEHMEAIGDLTRDVFRAMSDPARRDEVLTALGEIQEHIVAAKAMAPPGLDDQPEADRAGYADGFRKALAEVLIEMGRLEVEVIEGKAEEGVKRLREVIVPMRDAAHERYQVDE